MKPGMTVSLRLWGENLSRAACLILATAEEPRPTPSCAPAAGVRLAGWSACSLRVPRFAEWVFASHSRPAGPLGPLVCAAPASGGLPADPCRRCRSGRTRPGPWPWRTRHQRRGGRAVWIWARCSSMAWLKRRRKKPHRCRAQALARTGRVRLSQWGAMSLAWVPPLEGAEFTIQSGPCPVGCEAACAVPSRQDEGGKALHVSSVGLMRGTQVARRGMPWRLFTLSKRYRTTRFGLRATQAA